MTFAELIEAVRGNIGDRLDKDDVIRRAINWALRRACRDHDWRALDTRAERTTTPGVNYVELPADLRVLWAVRCDGKLMVEVHPMELEQLVRDSNVRYLSRPYVYVQTGASVEGATTSARAIRVYPIPDSTYTLEIYYNRWAKPLQNDSDEPEIPGIDDAIVAAATADVWMHMQQYEDASSWLSRYASELQAARSDDMERPGWRPGIAGRYVRSLPPSGGDPALDPFVKRVR